MIGRLVRIHNSKDWPQYEGKAGTVVKDYCDGDVVVNVNLVGRKYPYHRISIAKTQVRFEQSGGAS